jgi:predicted O-methyltransferase YrrM
MQKFKFRPWDLDILWEPSKERFKIQQIKEEWDWLIANTVGKWDEPKNILDVGVYDGGSTFYLNHFANNHITVDLHNPSRFHLGAMVCSHTYEYVGGDSHLPSMTEYFKKYDWDFVFIDGDHSYEGVKADFYNILPYLRKNTPVAFHDVVISDFHHTHGCYVGEFWEDLKKEYPATKFEEFKTNAEWAGIGIVWT